MTYLDDAVDRYARDHTTALPPALAAVAAATRRATPTPQMMGGLADKFNEIQEHIVAKSRNESTRYIITQAYWEVQR